MIKKREMATILIQGLLSCNHAPEDISTKEVEKFIDLLEQEKMIDEDFIDRLHFIMMEYQDAGFDDFLNNYISK